MYDDDLVRVIADLIKNGINMDKHSIYQCNLFMKDLHDFINRNSHFNAHHSGDKVTIESVFFDPLLSVELDKTTVQCIPVTDEGWMDALFEVMKFMHIRRQKEKEKEAELIKKIKKDSKEFDWI
jgi:hypothetical protein